MDTVKLFYAQSVFYGTFLEYYVNMENVIKNKEHLCMYVRIISNKRITSHIMQSFGAFYRTKFRDYKLGQALTRSYRIRSSKIECVCVVLPKVETIFIICSGVITVKRIEYYIYDKSCSSNLLV